MNAENDYSIAPNPKVAFTIIYKDTAGDLLFCVEPGNDAKKLYLNRVPSHKGVVLNQSSQTAGIKQWIQLAISRICSHYDALGVTVVVE